MRRRSGRPGSAPTPCGAGPVAPERTARVGRRPCGMEPPSGSTAPSVRVAAARRHRTVAARRNGQVGGEDEHASGRRCAAGPRPVRRAGRRPAGPPGRGRTARGGRAARADDDGGRRVGTGGEHPVQQRTAADGQGGLVRPAEPPGRASGQHDGVVVGAVVHAWVRRGERDHTAVPGRGRCQLGPRARAATGGRRRSPAVAAATGSADRTVCRPHAPSQRPEQHRGLLHAVGDEPQETAGRAAVAHPVIEGERELDDLPDRQLASVHPRFRRSSGRRRAWPPRGG